MTMPSVCRRNEGVKDMQWRSGRTQRGMTITELVVSMVVFTFIVGVTGAIYLAALRMYKEGFTGLSAHDNASLALTHLLPDAREAMDIIEPSMALQPTEPHVSDVLEYVLPRKDSTGHYFIDPTSPDGPLFWGTKVKVYLGDEYGTPDPNGTILWRVRSQIPSGSTSPPPYNYGSAEKIAEGITHVQFEHPVTIYSPSHYKLWDHVRMTIVGTATMWHKTVEATESAETAIRNHG